MQFKLDDIDNVFDECAKCVSFEIFGKRKFALVCDQPNSETVPLVRTTTPYTQPIQKMAPVHHKISAQLEKQIGHSLNNAMVEIYKGTYDTMKFHSDQALDLKGDSYIAIFTATNNPESKTPPQLHIKSKTKGGSTTTLQFIHNSAIIFSTATNATHVHTIRQKCPDNEEWLFITFRCSKTFIEFKNNVPYFTDGRELVLANDEQRRQFFQRKAIENGKTEVVSSEINYTISPGDLILPQ